jgi:alpha-glucosidase (family GH31 glycosyl hydrolase)
MGKYGSRWLGDNESIEKHMGYSVQGIMMMNMFGIPLAGSDICGFGGNTNPELCARWHVVGSYYPFSRNHNSIGSTPQEPYIFTGEYESGITYLDIMGDAIRTKYSLIRYYYTNLFMMSTQIDPKPFYKPVFFSYPEDPNT